VSPLPIPGPGPGPGPARCLAQIYNENLYDLLDITTQPHELNVHDVSGARTANLFAGSAGAATAAVRVTGLRVVPVGSEGEALDLLFEGETNRVVGEHQLNRESSRCGAGQGEVTPGMKERRCEA
jgi:hypothetical protein